MIQFLKGYFQFQPTFKWCYENYLKLLAPLIILSLLFLTLFFNPSSYYFWLLIHFPLYMLHQIEMHYKDRFCLYLQYNIYDKKFPCVNKQEIFIINVSTLGFILLFSVISPLNYLSGLIVIYFIFFKSVLHITLAVIKKNFQPGLIFATVQTFVAIYTWSISPFAKLGLDLIDHIVSILFTTLYLGLILAYIVIHLRLYCKDNYPKKTYESIDLL